MKERIAFLGGSFNPIHYGHIKTAEAVQKEYGLDKILFITAKDPPHKKIAGGVDSLSRLKMTELGLSEYPDFFASDLEIRREGKSYTAETLKCLQEAHPDAEIYCIVGADMLLDLPHWYDTETLFRLGHFIGVGRPGVVGELEPTVRELKERFGADIRLSAFEGPDLSSTEIRRRIEAAEPISGLTPHLTERYIYENTLYQPEEIRNLMVKLRRSLKEKRFLHSIGVLQCAVELAARYGTEGKKARLAALLHDCAKQDMQTQLDMAQAFGMDLSSYTSVSQAVLHGPIGAELARREYGISDEEILDAIRYHTVCRKNMTSLDKIVYLSDKIEWNRDYAGLEEIRKAAEKSLDAGTVACMEHSIRYVLEEEGKKLHPGILEAYVQLTKDKEEPI